MIGRRRATGVLLVVTLCIVVDQLTKIFAVHILRDKGPQSYLGGLLVLEYSENRGTFLSLGANLPDSTRFWLLVIGLGVLLAAILTLALLYRGLSTGAIIGLALIVGGGTGSWLDRVLHGNVVIDFLNVGIGPVRSGVFNVADLLVELGVVTVILANMHHTSSNQQEATQSVRRRA